jgi:hypothetical protein
MKMDENRRNFLAGCPNEESLAEIMDDLVKFMPI